MLTKAIAALGNNEFNGETSEDAWLFLMYLLDQLKAEQAEQNPGTSGNTVVEKLFEGTTSSSVSLAESMRKPVKTANTSKYKCSACPHEHKTPNYLRSLDLQLPRCEDAIHLQECIDKYSNEVFLPDYKCEDCGGINAVFQTTKLENAPKNLVIKLTRTDDQGKVSTAVRLPKSVVFDTESGKVRYQIISFVKHTGTW